MELSSRGEAIIGRGGDIMKKFKLEKHNYFYLPVVILAGISVLLLIVSFVVPPMGVIDPSVLKGVGELFGFAALLEVPHCMLISNGKKVSIKKGDTEVTVNDCDEEV